MEKRMSDEYTDIVEAAKHRRAETIKDHAMRLQLVGLYFFPVFAALLVLGALLLAIAIVVAHLIFPQYAWLSPPEQDRLAAVYSSATQFIAPLVLPILLRELFLTIRSVISSRSRQ